MSTNDEIGGSFGASEALRERARRIIPGGAHTYAKGDDQYPRTAPAFIARGLGSHVWDPDGHEYIEYGSGLRAVTLGHAHPRVLDAIRRSLAFGTNFTRPAPLEVEAAESLTAALPGAEMVKFAKNGSDVTSAAVKLARAFTGRDLVAICQDHPFFSIDDWFIGTTELNAGIPQAVRDLTVGFRYNDLESARLLFDRHPGRIACLVLEPATAVEPKEGFLAALKELCRSQGALLIFDEMITGFRWHHGGAQTLYNVTADLSAFGKGMANGFSVSALTGRRDVMERGGLEHPHERVFLLSTTHGAEGHSLAAAIETLAIYREEPVVERLYAAGARLRLGVEAITRELGLERHFALLGRDCNLVYATRDREERPSQAFRALFMQEIIRRGVIGPSFVVNYSHRDEDIDRTIEAVRGALLIYQRALEEGVETYLVGPPTRIVNRRFN